MSGASGTTARALIVLVVVFVAGGAAGVALDRAWWRGSEPPTHETRRAGVAEDQIPVPLLQLGLSPDEQTRLHAIARE